MDAIVNWGVGLVSAHPKVASWLMVVMAIDQVAKIVKNALKLNIDDNIFDTIGNIIGKILANVKNPK